MIIKLFGIVCMNDYVYVFENTFFDQVEDFQVDKVFSCQKEDVENDYLVDTTSFGLGGIQGDSLSKLGSDFQGPGMLRIRSSYSKLKERF